METHIFRCESSVEGIFTAIYDAFEARTDENQTEIEVLGTGASNYTLFAVYHDVDTDVEKAQKVARSVNKKLGRRVYEEILWCVHSRFEDRGTIAYRFLKKAFRKGPSIMDALGDKDVCRIFEIVRDLLNEAHFYREFIRFEEPEPGILLGKIEPKNNVAAEVMPHFRDRFPDDTIVIFDTGRDIAVFSKPGAPIVTAELAPEEAESLTLTSEDEDSFRSLWKVYHSSIAIKERINPKLQRNMCRLRFRKYMTEFVN